MRLDFGHLLRHCNANIILQTVYCNSRSICKMHVFFCLHLFHFCLHCNKKPLTFHDLFFLHIVSPFDHCVVHSYQLPIHSTLLEFWHLLFNVPWLSLRFETFVYFFWHAKVTNVFCSQPTFTAIVVTYTENPM